MEEGQLLTYYQHQIYLEKVVLLSGIPYEIKLNTLEERFFLVNQNNQLIYVDELVGKYFISVGEKKVRSS